jgi:hypothetical protein
MFQVFYNPYNNERNPFGDSKTVFDYISCWKAPEGNSHNSYLTFFSTGTNKEKILGQSSVFRLRQGFSTCLFISVLGGFTFGVINIVGNFGSVFCDQSYWQSSVAAKPLQVSTNN